MSDESPSFTVAANGTFSPVAESAAPPLPTNPRCAGHPSVPAVYSCDRCGAHVCPTCVFEIAGPRHLCPPCAVAGTTAISPRRRRGIIAGYIFGGIGAVTFALMMTGVFAPMVFALGNDMLFGWFITLIVFVPACTGLAWSWAAVEKRFRNPGALWGAVVLNALLASAFILLTVIGLFSE